MKIPKGSDRTFISLSSSDNFTYFQHWRFEGPKGPDGKCWASHDREPYDVNNRNITENRSRLSVASEQWRPRRIVPSGLKSLFIGGSATDQSPPAAAL
jgi:hypothetical protein